MSHRFGLTFDTADPRAEARFWQNVFGGPLRLEAPEPAEDGAGDWASLEDPSGAMPTIFFQRVPESKVAKNRLHLDIPVGGDGPLDERRARIDAEALRLKAIGATDQRGAYAEGQSYWVRMNDPEGNEFCLV
jgi:hypothetical protein